MDKKIQKSIMILIAPLFFFILSIQYKIYPGYLNTSAVNAKPNIQIYPGGQPIGVKLNTKGVLVVGLSNLKGTDEKMCNPANDSGVKVGDIIIAINGVEVNTCEEVSNKIRESEGKNLDLTLQRKDSKTNKTVVPIKTSEEGKYKIGLWIRDSTAGIGTLTFYHSETGSFGALGHAITDMDTGDIMKVREGKIIPSSIVSIRKGVRGEPGELRGIFTDENEPLGSIKNNTNCGIFGESKKELINKNFNQPLNVAYRHEVKRGKAQVLTTIEGEEPKLYDIEIEETLEQKEPGPKSMVIRITDKRLLNSTGGIIQGMSGSPIIQNNKVVGAVTHVLVNKPDVGYGIYIEWMLKDAGIVGK
ncbi:SpoIVB peptidase [Clostridium sp. KNHs214]|uniref:SpoIVB peptidase n=1 Tax=Clostridium sp. KNHs214 TaxID=1540257 RepID=UPI00068DD8EE|nr:SpoIVB peptidase [Clostridium sp. KNHs214]